MTASEFKIALQNASGEIIRIEDFKGFYLAYYKNTVVGYEDKKLIHSLQPNSKETWDIINPIAIFTQDQVNL